MTEEDLRVGEVLQLIASHRQELKTLTADAERIDVQTAEERLRRWKSRTVGMLRSNVSQSEADRLLNMQRDFVVSRRNPYSGFHSDRNKYDAFLTVLKAEIEEHPETVFQTPLPTAPQKVEVEKSNTDERGSVFIVHGLMRSISCVCSCY